MSERFDSDLFKLDPDTNEVSFKKIPDSANPSDSFGGQKTAFNNVYEFAIEAYRDYTVEWEQKFSYVDHWLPFEFAVEII